MASVSGTKQDKYGINMRTWCRDHEEQLQNHLLSFRGAKEAQASLHTFEEPLLTPEELLRLHRTKIQYLQHERLIHLIVLVMTVFGELFTVALVLALPETVPYSLIAMYGALPAADAQLATATSGAKMVLKKVEDEATLAELLKTAPEGYTPMYYEVIETRPIG